MMDEGSACGAIDLSSHSSGKRQREAVRCHERFNAAHLDTHTHMYDICILAILNDNDHPAVAAGLAGPRWNFVIVC